MQPFDTSRYSLPQPEGRKASDLKEWDNSCENAKSQLENISLRKINTELLEKYGSNSWLVYNKHLEHLQFQLKK